MAKLQVCGRHVRHAVTSDLFPSVIEWTSGEVASRGGDVGMVARQQVNVEVNELVIRAQG